jgi:ankyrin repeat protein
VRANLRTVMGVTLLVALSGAPSASGDRRLIEAVKRQDAAAARALLASRVDVNTAQPDGATALHWAAHWNDIEIATLLVRAGASVNAVNDHGITPLALACTNGSLPMVRLLLEGGANPNAASGAGETPLMTAARTGNRDLVNALLERGGDVKAADPERGQTALMWAISERHPDIVRSLMERGADVRVRSKGGYTPLLFAARVGDVESARLLVTAGAPVDDAAPDGSTPMLVAAVRGHAPLAMYLLECGAYPNVSAPGYTALHWASGTWETEMTGPNGITPGIDDEWSSLPGIQRGRLELVRALLARGADPNARLEKMPPRVGYSQLQVEHRVVGVNMYPGATPFLLAAMAADVDVMRLLVEHGANPGVTASDGTTPLMVAAGLGRYLAESRVTEARALPAVALALELGSDINGVNEAGNTALHGAAYIKANTIVRYLAEHGARLDVANKRGQTPLAMADTVRAGSATVASRTETGDLLRKLGADIGGGTSR